MPPRQQRRSRMAVVACLVSMIMPASAGYEVLRTFRRPATQPLGKLLPVAGGGIYGTASAGGAHDHGGVFRVTAGGDVETMVSFTGNGGAAPGSGPVAGLVAGIDGTFYGTTSSGGAGNFGTIFKLTPAGDLTSLVSFTGSSGAAAGAVPGPLVSHADGFFYGTTAAGGAGGQGTVFRMSADGVLTTLAEFTGTTGAVPGSEPTGMLAMAGDQLYGVTRTGGAANSGTIFRISTSGTFTTLWEFSGANGARPAGGLLSHSDGLLYGTTEAGGAAGFGTAFSLGTAATPVFSLIRSFDDLEGSQPVGTLVARDATTLLGTVAGGGTSGWGGVYQLTTGGAFSMLVDFSGESGDFRGAAPRAGLAAGPAGDFHGCTSAGGPGQAGTVFRISSSGVFTATASLTPEEGWRPSGAPVADGADGWIFPMAAGGGAGGGTLIRWEENAGLSIAATLGGSVGSAPDGALFARSGVFHGVASQGAASARGSAFLYDPAAGVSLISNFTTTGGSLPDGPLIEGSDTALYGVSREGGTSGRGTLYKVTTAGARTRIVSFTGTSGASPGTSPRGPLVLAPNQSYYGVTARGGNADSGVLFKLSPLGTYTPLAHFQATGPRLPEGGLLLAADGFIYGTCSRGGEQDAGTVFRLDPANDSWSVVASFDGTGAASPAGDLHAAVDGSLYGIASGPGHGSVFRYAGDGGLQVVVHFTGADGTAPGSAVADDGAGQPFTGGIASGPGGVLFGTAAGGGPDGGGVWFRVTPDTPLEAWKTEHLGSPDAPDDGDPDHDGLANVVEYSQGTPPTHAGAGPIRTFAAGLFSLTVTRDPARSDIVMLVEVSSDLVVWTPLATSLNGLPFSGAGEISGETPGPAVKTVVVSDRIGFAAAARRFMRLRVISGFTPASPLEAWKMTFLGEPAAPDDGDPDHDQRANLLEYALGSLPTVRDAAGLPVDATGEFLSVTVPRDPARDDITLTVEVSPDLADPWLPLATSVAGSAFSGQGHISGETPGESLKSVVIRDTIPLSGASRRFIRLRVDR